MLNCTVSRKDLVSECYQSIILRSKNTIKCSAFATNTKNNCAGQLYNILVHGLSIKQMP